MKTFARLSFPILVALVIGVSFVLPDAPGFKMFAVEANPEAQIFDRDGVEIVARAFTYKALYGFDDRKALQFAEWACKTKRWSSPFQINSGPTQVQYHPQNCELGK